MSNIDEDILERSHLIKKRIEMLLAENLGTPQSKFDLLNKVACYALFSGGKYIRGFIAMEIAKHFSIETNNQLTLAAIIEIIHCYSLIHDDLPAMDNSDLRRGTASSHKKFGEDNALLAGNLLFSCAVCIANKYCNTETVQQIHKFSSLMIRGQAIDLSQKINKSAVDEIIHLYKLKTGAMFALSAILGYSCTDKIKADTITNLEEFGYNFGILFQIYDDIEDKQHDEKNLLDIISKTELQSLIIDYKHRCKENLVDLGFALGSNLFKIMDFLFANNTSLSK